MHASELKLRSCISHFPEAKLIRVCDIATSLVMMAPFIDDDTKSGADTNVRTKTTSLRTALCSEDVALASRFRALFSLKYLASQPPSPTTSTAIQAIAAAFASPSALLKHELAYCLGQTKNLEASPFLRDVLQDQSEDPMCRHEAAEALGALGDITSLDLLKENRDDPTQPVVVRETCQIAVDRIIWEHSEERRQEKLRAR